MCWRVAVRCCRGVGPHRTSWGTPVPRCRADVWGAGAGHKARTCSLHATPALLFSRGSHRRACATLDNPVSRQVCRVRAPSWRACMHRPLLPGLIHKSCRWTLECGSSCVSCAGGRRCGRHGWRAAHAHIRRPRHGVRRAVGRGSGGVHPVDAMDSRGQNSAAGAKSELCRKRA